MAIFEKSKGSRRYYANPGDGYPTAPGGIPAGSVVHYLGTKNSFIFDGVDTWTVWEQDDDVVGMLEEVRDAVDELLPHLRIIREASALMANDQVGSNLSTDDE